MLDIKLIREKPDFIKAELAKVGVAPMELDNLIACDGRRRQLQHQLDEMRARRSKESRDLAKAPEQERDAKRAEMRALGDTIAAGEKELGELERKCEEMMLELPNLPRAYVPIGKDESANKIVRTEGEQRAVSFKPLPHWELGEKLGIIDFERGVKLAGS